MSFISSVLLLLGLGCAILVPIFFGHALSNEHGQRFYGTSFIADGPRGSSRRSERWAFAGRHLRRSHQLRKLSS